MPSTFTTGDLREVLTALAHVDTGVSDAERIDQLGLLESLKAAAAAAQARVSADFAASQREAQAAAGAPARERGRGIAAQIALARRDSPVRGSRHLGLATALVHEMPHTMGHLQAGRVSEWRATLVARETACLTVEERAEVDRRLGPDLPTLGDREVTARAKAIAAHLAPESLVHRAGKAQHDRRVTLRPAPDTMTYLTALLPVAQGVAAYAALERAACTPRDTTDPRPPRQVMADTLVERLTGQTTADAVPIEVQLVMPARTLPHLPPTDPTEPAEPTGPPTDPVVPSDPALATWPTRPTEPMRAEGERRSADEPALVTAPGLVPQVLPAAIARDLVRRCLDGTSTGHVRAVRTTADGADVESVAARAAPLTPATLHRLVRGHPSTPAADTTPAVPGRADTAGASSSPGRFFRGTMRRLVLLRDQTCRTPWCDAPIRHTDHVTPDNRGGRTTRANAQGLCEACNYTKQAPGWSARAGPDGVGPHTVVLTTPTGHTHTTHPPPLLPSRSRASRWPIHIVRPTVELVITYVPHAA